MSSLDRILPFLRPIEDLLRDPAITEVMVNCGGRRVFVERSGALEVVPERTLEPGSLPLKMASVFASKQCLTKYAKKINSKFILSVKACLCAGFYILEQSHHLTITTLC
jgi:hypothetical protein